MNNGYVKLWRKIIESQIFQNEHLLKVWIWCLIKANHESAWVSVQTGSGYTQVEILPGQFIFGRNKSAHELKMDSSSVYKRIKKLEKLENITIQSNSHFSLISIINWDTYQCNDKIKKQTEEQAGNKQVTSRYQAGNTNKNDKNEKNIYSEKIFDFYISEIKPERKSKIRALKNIDRHLKKYSEGDLEKSITNYSGVALKSEPKFRKDPANFFGTQDPSFIDYLPCNFKPEQKEEKKQPENLFRADWF